jgi:hypothetical protein
MPWKINAQGVFDYHEHDPERIREVDPANMVVFGVKIESRFGHVAELVSMLRFVSILQVEQPATVLAMDSVFWDCCTATVTLRNIMPCSWRNQDAEHLADAFWDAGGCPMLYVEQPNGLSWEFESIDPKTLGLDIAWEGAQ